MNETTDTIVLTESSQIREQVKALFKEAPMRFIEEGAKSCPTPDMLPEHHLPGDKLPPIRALTWRDAQIISECLVKLRHKRIIVERSGEIVMVPERSPSP